MGAGGALANRAGLSARNRYYGAVQLIDIFQVRMGAVGHRSPSLVVTVRTRACVLAMCWARGGSLGMCTP